MAGSIPGEKKCVGCDCTFINKKDPAADRCSVCAGRGANAAGAGEQFIYQDVSRSDIARQLNVILDKVNLILKRMGDESKEAKTYSKKCDTCGQVFVSEAPAARYCDECKQATEAGK